MSCKEVVIFVILCNLSVSCARTKICLWKKGDFDLFPGVESIRVKVGYILC